MKEDLIKHNNPENIIISKCKLKPNARSFNIDKMIVITQSGCVKQTAKKFRSITCDAINVESDSDIPESEQQTETESPS